MQYCKIIECSHSLTEEQDYTSDDLGQSKNAKFDYYCIFFFGQLFAFKTEGETLRSLVFVHQKRM
jgi:hypothetical protein